MKKCKYCIDAFTNVYEEDSDYDDLIVFNVKILGAKHRFRVKINTSGQLELVNDSDCDVESLAKRKINFCPMCGREIPKITPTDEERNRRR